MEKMSQTFFISEDSGYVKREQRAVSIIWGIWEIPGRRVYNCKLMLSWWEIRKFHGLDDCDRNILPYPW